MPCCARIKPVLVLLALLGLMLVPAGGMCLEPDEVLVIANTRAADSLELARFYMARRAIPSNNLVRLSTAAEERCSRQTYEEEIRQPVRQALGRLGRRIRCLVTLYGVPLAILPHKTADRDQMAPVESRLEELRQQAAVTTDSASLAALEQQIAEAETLLGQLGKMDSAAAVDSELALAPTEGYPLQGRLANPYFLGFRQQKTLLERDRVLMVSRLDGPDPATVRRLVDDALAAEKAGLKGQACFDARWSRPGEKHPEGYALYDASLHAAADRVRSSGRMAQVRLDSREALFQAGDCPQAALYCGWYSLARYVDAFDWVRGAIGYHIASAECTTLKQPGSQVWCKRMLEDGAAAVIGPVGEPYVEAFPLPDLFFGTLVDGYLGLGEAYLISLPFLSWQMVLIGDPLYQPFGSR